MSESNTSKSQPDIQVTLDGAPVALGPEDQHLLAAVRACLQRVALRHQRTLVGLSVEGATSTSGTAGVLQSSQNGEVPQEFSPEVKSTYYRTLRARLSPLRPRVERLALLVLINDWATIERLWWELLPELRNAIMNLSVLEDPGTSPTAGVVDDVALAAHLEVLTQVLQQLSHALAKRDPFELSDVLDQCLSPWLKQLDAFLAKLS